MTTNRAIIMDTEAVRGILDGCKTQTRRPISPQPPTDIAWGPTMYYPGRITAASPTEGAFFASCPFGAPGECLHVRESLIDSRPSKTHLREVATLAAINTRTLPEFMAANGLRYLADGPAASPGERVIAAKFMPQWASRLTLEVTNIRVERLQEIGEDDCEAEGIICPICGYKGLVYDYDYGTAACACCSDGYRPLFRAAWNARYGKRRTYGVRGVAWDANPWVWVITFRHVGV